MSRTARPRPLVLWSSAWSRAAPDGAEGTGVPPI
jgi:hypothetical protein